MIHPTRSVALSFRLTPQEVDALRQLANEADQSVSNLIRARLFDYAAVPMVKRLPGEAVGPVHDGRHPDCLVCAPLRAEAKAHPLPQGGAAP